MKYICLDLEMSEMTYAEQGSLSISKEIIQIGAVILDEAYHFVDEFEIYVKPQFSRINEHIYNLTGITNENVENAPDFITAFEKYLCWIDSKIGKEKYTTFCWSNVDHNQLNSEIYVKARNRDDFLIHLETFVDLQRTFGEVLGTKFTIGLEKAIEFCHETFKGQAHTAKADALNTAVILNKLCRAKNLNPQFHILSDSTFEKIEAEKREDEKLQKSMNSTFGSFFSEEILAKFGLKKEQQEKQEEECLKESETDYSNYVPAKLSKREKKILKLQQKEQKKRKLLSPEIQSQIANSHPTLKYNIAPADWMKFYVQMIYTRSDCI